MNWQRQGEYLFLMVRNISDSHIAQKKNDKTLIITTQKVIPESIVEGVILQKKIEELEEQVKESVLKIPLSTKRRKKNLIDSAMN